MLLSLLGIPDGLLFHAHMGSCSMLTDTVRILAPQAYGLWKGLFAIAVLLPWTVQAQMPGKCSAWLVVGCRAVLALHDRYLPIETCSWVWRSPSHGGPLPATPPRTAQFSLQGSQPHNRWPPHCETHQHTHHHCCSWWLRGPAWRRCGNGQCRPEVLSPLLGSPARAAFFVTLLT